MKTTNTIKNFAMRFVAIMAVVLLAGNAWGEQASITFSSLYNSNTVIGEDAIEIVEGITVSFTDGGTATQYYTNGTSIRWYGGGTMTISSTIGNITAVTITYTRTDNDISADAGTWNSPNWSCNNNDDITSVTFTEAGTSGHLRISTISVTYTPLPSGYAVTYDAGEHGTAPDGATASSVTLAAITGVTGYTCTGWVANKAVKEGNTSKAAGTALSNGTTYTILEATTFTAQWRANTYKVDFDANGGSGSMSKQDFEYGTAQNLTANGFTAPAHKYFLGWHKTKAQADLGNREYTNEESVSNLTSEDVAEIKLYAVWKDHTYKNYRTVCNDKYTVTYVAPDATSGQVPTDATEYDKNDEVTVLGGGTLAKTNYSFAGWTDGANNYEAGDKFNITDFVTLSAVWECAKAVEVSKATTTTNGSFTLDKSGELATCDGDVVVTVTPSANTGYEFSAITQTGLNSGVTINQNAKTVTYAQFSEGESEINVTFTAKHITVTWDVNGGVALEDETSEYIYNGSTVSLPTPTRTGYTFDGWFTETSGGTKITEIGTTNKPSSNVTYHAHWTKNKYKVYFRNNGVAIDDAAYAAKEVYYGDAIGTLPAYDANKFASCDGTSTVFKGWSEATIVVKQPDAPTFASSATVMGAKDMYLNAVFATETSGTPIEHAGPSFSRSGKQNTITNGYTLTNYSDADDSGFYKDKTPNGGTCYLGIYKSNAAIFSSTPASITATVKVGGGLGSHELTDPVLVQLLDNTGQPIGTAATVTEYITTATGDTYSDISIPTTGITSAYGLRVSHIKENSYNVRYYSFSLKYYTATVSYTDYVTACCTLTGVENVTAVDNTSNTQVTLNWDELSDEQQAVVSKLQVVDADDVTDVIVDDLAASATSATITGLTRCETYSYRVAVVGTVCTTYSDAVDVRPIGDAKTVTFDNDYEGGAVTSETTTCDEDEVALATPDSREGYRFMGWFNGDVEVTANPYTPTATVTLKAHWEKEYTLHYDYAGATGAPEDHVYIAGEEIALPADPSKNFLTPFEGWDYSVAVTMVDETHFEMPASDLTVTAVFGGTQGQWLLVTNKNQLAANQKVVIAAKNSNVAMSTTQNNNNRGQTGITKKGSFITAPSDNVQIFALEAGTKDNTWAFKCLNGDNADQYIYAASSSNNYLKSEDNISDNSSWVLDVTNGKATAQGTNTNNNLQHNSNLFSCYSGTQSPIEFYHFVEGEFYEVVMPAEAPTGGTVKVDCNMVAAGETVTLTYTPNRGYTVGTLTVTGLTSGNVAISPALAAGVTEYTYTMPAEEVTVAATFTALPPVVYNLLEDVNDLAMGQKFVFVGTNAGGDEAHVAGAINNGRLSGAPINNGAINTTDKTLSLTDESAIDYVIEGEPGALKIMHEGKYLQEASSNKVSWDNVGREWSISIADDDKATIQATVQTTIYKFQYNTSGEYFTAYTSDQQPIYIYTLPAGETFNLVIKNGDDSDKKSIKIAEGYTYTYTLKDGDAPTETPGDTYEFAGKWTDGAATYTVGDEVVVSAAKTLTPCWEVTLPAVEPGEAATINSNTLPASVTEIVVGDNMTFNVTSDKTYDNLTVETGGKVSGEGNMTVNDFTIESEAGKSGQLTSTGNVTINGDLILEIKLCEGTLDATKYYCISAPFDVNMNGGFAWGNGTPMVFNQDFQLFEYQGDKRARTGNGWQRVSGTMHKNTAYFIVFDASNGNNQNVIRLKATEKSIPTASSITFTAHPSETGDDYDANWNGSANPTLHYIGFDAIVQVFDCENQNFNPKYTSANSTEEQDVHVDYGYVVGTPFFYKGSGEISFNNTAEGAYRAPQRHVEKYTYCVRISEENATRFDNQLYVMASENAEAQYVEGHDVPTMNSTTSNYGALIWTNNYGVRLAVEEAPLVNQKASYALGIFAPTSGTYTISVATPKENAELYLTKNGRICWNLTMGACEVELAEGQNNEYGLLLRAEAPQVTTGVENGELLNGANGVQKVIIDEHVYILRGEQLYGVDGKAVK